jgi:hypothetical protein
MRNSWFSMLDQTDPRYRTNVISNCGDGSCAFFISRELWLGNSNTGWVEVGIRNGYQDPRMKFADGRPGCGCQAYFTFWEDGPGDPYDHTHLIEDITPDDSTHTYKIESSGLKKFRITIDDREVGVARTNFAAAIETAIGSETSALTTVQPLSYMNSACQWNWGMTVPGLGWRYVKYPNGGVRGSGVLDSPDQTYFGAWNDKSHEFCIGKGGL